MVKGSHDKEGREGGWKEGRKEGKEGGRKERREVMYVCDTYFLCTANPKLLFAATCTRVCVYLYGWDEGTAEGC